MKSLTPWALCFSLCLFLLSSSTLALAQEHAVPAASAPPAAPLTDQDPHAATHAPVDPHNQFPRTLASYDDDGKSIRESLAYRIAQDPLNLVATIIFFCAILHTFMTSRFIRMAHAAADKHKEKARHIDERRSKAYNGTIPPERSFKAEVLHFLGEVEAVFGIWIIVLMVAIAYFKGLHVSLEYLNGVNFTEPMFVVVIMALAASRPITQFAERSLKVFAKLLGGKSAAWWLVILTIGPLLGSFITEPGAMTIAAMLLAKQIYTKNPSLKLRYATIGLLFVNVSVGGTLSHFAAPPVLMVATVWDWDFMFMLTNFGWKAILGILASNMVYFAYFRNEFKEMDGKKGHDAEEAAKKVDWNLREEIVPAWIVAIHVLFMVWTVYNAHHPALFIGAFLFFVGFHQATNQHQNRLDLKPPIMVGFFLAALVTHGGLQAWWIQPVLSSLGRVPLMLSATILTAFNDNAAITYLSSLVPDFSTELKYAVVAGAVAGGGLTVIANAPNPAGQSILNRYFPDGVVPIHLAIAAIIPTIIVGCAFMLLP